MKDKSLEWELIKDLWYLTKIIKKIRNKRF